MKKIFSILLILLLASCDLSGSKTPTKESPKMVNVNIVQMNDIHGHIEQTNGKNGISNAAFLIDEIRNEDEYDNTLLIGNGDMFQETALSRLSYGEVVIDCMNEMKFDCLGIGNHEFDWGIDRIFNYFDGDETNGEANFPLVNSNIYYKNKIVTDEKIYESLLVEKENVKIGVISLIGNVMGSINANMTVDYSFKAQSYEMESIVLDLGSKLKDKGADIIVVNIHDGESSGIDKYEPNEIIGNVKYNDKYLVDAIINGHTHTKQAGFIHRNNGNLLPVIQSNGGLATIGRIDLEYDTVNKQIADISIKHISVNSAGYNYNEKVEEIVDQYYANSKDIIEEVYCKNESKLSRYNDNLTHYTANLMMKATGATAACGNFGGFRNDITDSTLNFSNVYALNPFDNHIILCKIKGSDLYKFLMDNQSHNYVYTEDGNFVSDKIYTLAIIDYVYFSYYFRSYRTSEYEDTLLEVRDLMIEDFRLRESFNVNKDYNNILISKIYE